MTNYQQKFLDHLVRMAAQDKALAWWSAKNYAAMDPHRLAEMPKMLTARMLQLQSSKPSEAAISPKGK